MAKRTRYNNPNGNMPPINRRPINKPARGIMGTISYWLTALALWGVVAGICVFIWVISDLPDPDEIWRKTDRAGITFVDINGKVIDTRGVADAPPVDLNTIPKYVPAAVVAIEDRKFYHHWGVDLEGLARAMIINLRAGHIVQGGSTITQQLAKNLFLSSDQNLKRKAQEVLLAFWLESRFTKDQIMSLYLARVYFGSGAFGITEASQRYFAKPPSQLTISEAALLAGMLKAPSKYNPVSSTKRAAERATVVLNVMEEEGVITHEQRIAAVKQPLRFVPRVKGSNVGYFIDWIQPQISALIDTKREDLVVQTTLDLSHQEAAENAISSEFNQNAKSLRMSQSALVAIAEDGGVRAMVGGRSYNESEFNRVIDAKRQPGSAFKPFVYVAALEKGDNPYSVRVDRPVRVGNWTPQNYEGGYKGAMTLINAFSHSTNSIAVMLAEEVGRDNVIRVARRLGIRSRLDPEPTIALGTEVVSPMELTAAYVPFSNGGNAVTPFGFYKITTRSGQIVWQRPISEPRKVIDDTTLRNMNLMFRQVVLGGTARGAQLDGRVVGGKTGTTSDYRDAWFIGFIGGYTTGVWVGNDDFAIKMNKVTGGSAPARIWKAFMSSAIHDIPNKTFALPYSVTRAATPNTNYRPQAQATGQANNIPSTEQQDSQIANSINSEMEAVDGGGPVNNNPDASLEAAPVDSTPQSIDQLANGNHQ